MDVFRPKQLNARWNFYILYVTIHEYLPSCSSLLAYALDIGNEFQSQLRYFSQLASIQNVSHTLHHSSRYQFLSSCQNSFIITERPSLYTLRDLLILVKCIVKSFQQICFYFRYLFPFYFRILIVIILFASKACNQSL